MKRKVPASSRPPPELLTFDPEHWTHEAWCSARAAWVAAGGAWPGGEDQRELREAMITPDEPWDVSEAVPPGASLCAPTAEHQ